MTTLEDKLEEFEQAYNHYSECDLWEESWVEDCKEDIENKREFLKSAGVL